MGGKKRRNQGKTEAGAGDWRGLPKHALYEASVQNVESDADFVERVYRKSRGRRAHSLREDFCGTASLAAHWVTRHRKHVAYGTDLHQPTLDWGMEHRVGLVGKKAKRVHLECGNVLHVHEPRVDVQVAFNFSYFVFHTRDELGRYFQAVAQSLDDEGIFVLDCFGGSASVIELEETTEVEGRTDPAGFELPDFEYVWDQQAFNPIDHRLLCSIHFRFGKEREMRRAFRYDWRFWTLPEIRELLADAGFAQSHVYVEGWDEEEEGGDGVFRKRKRFDNEGGWLAYIVALK